MGSHPVTSKPVHPWIYINGYPGIGKLTIARQLEELLPDSKVYDNHLLIDPIAPLADRSDPDYDAVRTDFRRYMLDKIANSPRERTWIFTDSRCDLEGGSNAVKDYVDAAKKRGVPLIPVYMTCEVGENLKRIVDYGRRGTKLRDEQELLRIREKEDMFRLGGELELELDVTELSPLEAALRIRLHVTRVVEIGEP